MQAVTHSGAQAPAIVLSPIRAGLPVGGGTLEVLVRVQAPTPSSVGDDSADPAVKVPRPLRLALVVDRSGSMDGEPLSEALRCVDHIAGRLTMRDQLAVLFYDGQVQVPLPLATAGCPDLVHAALTGVESGGCTDLHSGWEAGARQLETGSKGSLSRVILLSDGQANSGLVDQAQSSSSVRVGEMRASARPRSVSDAVSMRS